MSSRFERRPEKRSGGGGAGRGPGKPARFSAPRPGGDRPDWRRGADEAGSGDRGAGGERGERPVRADRRPMGDRGRPSDRPFSARPRGDRPSFGDRPAAGGRPSFGDRPAAGGRPAFGGRPSFGARPGAGDRPAFSGRRPGDRPSYGDRPAGTDRPSYGDRRGADRSPDRPSDRGPAPRSFADRPAGDRPFRDRPPTDRFPRRPGARPAGRPLGRPAFSAGADGERRPFERSGERRFSDRGPARGAGRFGARPMAGSRPFDRSAPAEPIVEAPPEADRFGQSPADDLIWGRHPALAALESGRPVHRIWCTPEMRFSPKFLQLLREAKSGGVLVEEVTWARLGQITGGAVHQGIVLQTAAAETLDLPTLMDGCRDLGEPPLLMAVDGLTDPHNLGAIVRSAESLGAHGLVLPQRRTAGLTGTVAKVAAGALEHLPVARVVNLNRALDTLKQEGYRVIGLAEEGTVGLHEADLDGPLVVVTGSEGTGLSLLTRRTCDQLIRIPLRGATPSLNASVATSLMLYEIARRGWMKSLSGTAPAPRIVRPQLPAPAARIVVSDESTGPLEDSDRDLEPDSGFGAGVQAADADLLDFDLQEDAVSPGDPSFMSAGSTEQEPPLEALPLEALPFEELADLAGVQGAAAGAPATSDSPALAVAEATPGVGLERNLEAPAATPVFQANIQL